MENIEAFFALVRAGLWGKVNENQNENLFEALDWEEVLKLAEEQSVVGLVTAGIQISGAPIPLAQKLKFVGKCQLIEERNVAMNHFVGGLVAKMKDAGIDALLIKGQGLAQCYERPLWRTSGDVDFLLSDKNYEKAKQLLLPLATDVDKGTDSSMHTSMTIGSFTVDLHSTLHCNLSCRMDKVLDEIKEDVLEEGAVRVWQNGNTQIQLLGIDCDVVFVFCHFLKHFYKGGIGLKQICDWCRLIWAFRDDIDDSRIDLRLRQMRLLSEWKAFAALAVELLDMPGDVMPLYDSAKKWKRKARQIKPFLIKSGNLGQNRDTSYYNEYPYLIRKAFSFKRRMGDIIHHSMIFPMGTIRFSPTIVKHGLVLAFKSA